MSLDLKNEGQTNWLWDDGKEIYVSYQEYGDSIYQSYGKGLREIDKKTGKTIRNIRFVDIKGLPKFQASGSFDVYDKYLLFEKYIEGRIVLLDRVSWEVVAVLNFGSYYTRNSPHARHIQDGYLYIHTSDCKLHIFKESSDISSNNLLQGV